MIQHAIFIMRTFTTTDVLTFLSEINPASAPSEVQTEFGVMQATLTQLGFTSADQAIILQLLLTADPQAVSTLGVGAFPQSLVDPANNTALQQLGSALISNAPSATTLSPSFSVTLAGDYVAAGVGLRGNTSGNIIISGVPSGASIVRAFLYWGMLDNGEDASLHQLTLNGTPVNGSLIGSGPDTCWGRANSFTYRAEVTPLVAGNGTYALTGVATGGNILAEGASLVVIYQLAGAPVKTVMLEDGNVSMPFGTQVSASSFSGFTATSPVSATTTFMVGDGQAVQFNLFTPVSFTGSLGTLSFPGLFASNNGPLWDTDTFSVSSVIGAGNSSDSATIRFIGNCLLWSAQAFSVTSVPVTTPVTATAAVVEAGANGDTVANVRGLASTDAPTLTDQIAMVVEFRTIQNPSISGANLTTQLVNGLVNDGVISSAQASSIIQAVESLVVPPKTSPDTTPPIISCGSPDGAWHATDVTIPCTASDPESGLKASSPASFTLTTSVAAGTETANAFTNTQLECDNAGNCATAGRTL